MEEKIQENERKWEEYDKACNEAYTKAQAIITTNFVETFNDTFYCKVDKYGIPVDGFIPKEGYKRGDIKKDWLKIYIYNLIYDLFQIGCVVGIEKINGKWIMWLMIADTLLEQINSMVCSYLTIKWSKCSQMTMQGLGTSESSQD